MKLKKLEFEENVEGEALPSKVTVEMSIEEALWISLHSGKQIGISPHSGIFNCLVGDVFNRFWDNGQHDLQKELNIPLLPINYGD